jgi:cytochrome c oxidase assembly protein subunit 15
MTTEIPHSLIRRWLLLGLIMIFFQIVIGGITRLTGSGLSITEWNVIMGTFPPMSETQWQELFEKYKQFPQYKIINNDMNLSGFKTIFWWEYIHRLWARLFALVFLIPFVYFIYRKWLSKKLIIHLSVLFLLGAAQGLIGWIMVKSGLKNNPWVDPLNLSIHLMMALFVYAYLLHVFAHYTQAKKYVPQQKSFIIYFNILILLLVFQIFYGALMAGHKAALFYPTWPKIGNDWIPSSMMSYEPAWLNLFESKALIHFIHRNLAYILACSLLLFWFNNRKHIAINLKLYFDSIPIIVITQVLLGIITVINALGHIPALWGVLHQAVAIILLTVMLYLRFRCTKPV